MDCVKKACGYSGTKENFNVRYDKRYGRSGRCPACGTRMKLVTYTDGRRSLTSSQRRRLRRDARQGPGVDADVSVQRMNEALDSVIDK